MERDLARERLDTLIAAADGGCGIRAEARDISGQHDMSGAEAVDWIISRRWPTLSERQAHEACAHRYEIELPA